MVSSYPPVLQVSHFLPPAITISKTSPSSRPLTTVLVIIFSFILNRIAKQIKRIQKSGDDSTCQESFRKVFFFVTKKTIKKQTGCA